MKKFRQKDFAAIVEGAKKLVKKSPVLPVSVASLGVASTNLALNSKRKEQDKSYQERQLQAMEHLTESLNKVDKSLEKIPTTPKKKKKKEEEDKKEKGFWLGRRRLFSNNNKMIVFKKKDFSILSDTVRGASIGASLGTFGSVFAPKKVKFRLGKKIKNDKIRGKLENVNRFGEKYNDLKSHEKKLAIVGAGTIIGAALGALVGLVKESDKFISRTNVDKRLMKTVIENLKKQHFKEGQDFTRDPKIADQLKTKVCIVITKYSGDLRILINTISDKKLDNLTEQTIKNLQNTSVVNKKASNNYNEITISTISDGSADAGLITGICEKFIHSGYPVYLVEVG